MKSFFKTKLKLFILTKKVSQHELKLVFLAIHLTIYHSVYFSTFDIEITLSSQNWFRSDVCNSMILLSDFLLNRGLIVQT